MLCCYLLSCHYNSRRRDRDASKPQQQHSYHDGGEGQDEDETTAFDYGDDFNSDVDDIDGGHGSIRLHGELSGCASVGGDDDGVEGEDDLDAQLRMALMSTPSDVPTHRPSQCERDNT